MKALLTVGATAVLAVYAGWAWGDQPRAAPSRVERTPVSSDWIIWPSTGRAKATTAAPAAAFEQSVAEIDVVDAHWMALTMWGEARGQGEEAMRAVGHVIDNRRRAGMHGAFVTDTVGEAFQFSCWNAGDSNRTAIENVDRLREGSREQRMWRTARRLAEEIMAGRSQDPTGGALFYHSMEVSPRWSQGIAPVAYIGGHLFFRNARS